MVDSVEFAHRRSVIDGLLVLTMKQVRDERGTVCELFRRSAFEAAGVAPLRQFAQINVTGSGRGVIRGLHAEAMTKLVAVVAGEALGAYVDLRPDSPTRGTVETVELVAGTQVLVPDGVANGFQSLVEATLYAYCFDDEWQPGMVGLACDPLDPALGIAWPLPIDPTDRALLSAKDADLPSLAEVLAGAAHG
ncbi:MAG: dTDP-4-dehydrorhamnose 3,5-epimerase family protein [Acidimicrobiia bacterium]|nr:dTDP-4-dehydrorhamnose 3,5-epimerase family protein [Acidimicrobiia bacterium]